LRTVQNAHRIYVLANGSVVEQGTHETLMAQEGSKYQEMVKTQEIQKIESVDDEETTNVQTEGEEEEDEKHSCMNIFSFI
jgi:ABC-type glutathione transport system ATPase component